VRKSIFLLLIAIAVPLHAGEWGSRGVSRRFALNGNILYAADGRGVTVYDVSNPANIRQLDVETGDDETRDLALMGNTLFVATARGIDRFAIAGNGTLTRGETSRELHDVTRIAANDRLIAAVTGETVTIFDADLTRIRTFKFAGAVRAVTFIGGVLYGGVEGIAVYAYDPETAIQLELLPVDAADFALSGSTLWVAGPHGLVSLDVSAPAAPRILGNAGSGIWKLSSVAATGTRVYAVELPDSVRVFDATTPHEPRLLTEMHEWVHTIAASGTRLFLSGSRIDAEGLPFETGLPVRIFDSLTLVGEYKDLAGPVNGAWTDGSIAFIVDPPYLRVLDVSKTAQPRELTSIVVPDIQDHIRVRDGMAILYGRSDVNFIDVSDPYKPKYLGTYDALGHPRSAAAFLRDTIVEANENSGLHIVDYSDPAKAHQISGRIWHYHDVVAGDDAVYVLQLANFLVLEITPDHRVIDRVNENILITQQVDTIPPSSGSPSYVVLRGVDAIEFLSLEDRFNPREVATIPMPRSELMGTSATSVFVSIDGRLSRIDVTDPETVVETEMRVSSPQQIAVAGEKLVIADRYSVRVYGPDTEPPAPSTVLRRRSTRH
jgi:hypothetical protein